MAYAQVSDVQARFERELDEYEEVVVAQRLDDAELLIKARIPNLDDQISDGKIPEELVIMAEADAVLALIRNPDAKVGETDGNYSYQLNWATATGVLTIPERYWPLLGVTKGRSSIAPKFYAVDELYSNYPFYPESLMPWYVGPPGGPG